MEIEGEGQVKRMGLANIASDMSAWSLVLSNAFTVLLAVIQRWDLLSIMLIYWCQSVIIGFFNVIRILELKNFSTEGLKINGRPVDPTTSTKIQVAVFFALHYGFFHFIYLFFLFSGNKTYDIDLKFIVLTAAVFFANHLFSFLYNRGKDKKKENIGRIMFFPYARIVPMHLTIILGASVAGGGFSAFYTIFFLGLKTTADLIMHSVEHA